MRWLRRRLGMLADETGSALVEFVFIALVVFVPLVYIVAGFSAVQRGVFASTAAAREAGRAIGTAPDVATGMSRANRAAQLAVEDQAIAGTDVRVTYAAAGVDCANSGGYTPTLAPGEEFSVCVTVTVRIPFLPEFIDSNTATGQFVVERDRYADAQSSRADALDVGNGEVRELIRPRGLHGRQDDAGGLPHLGREIGAALQVELLAGPDRGDVIEGEALQHLHLTTLDGGGWNVHAHVV